jgi:putative ABC transport system permease protein
MIFKQLNFLNERSLGFQKEQILTIPLFSQNLNSIFGSANEAFQSRLQAYRDAIETESSILNTTLSSNAPGLGAIYRGTIPEGFTQESNLFIANLAVDYDFFKTYGIQVIAGRSFDRDFGTDATEGFMVNQTALKEFNWGSTEEAIGKTLIREGKKGQVIGIVQDFNMTSLTTPVSALVIEVNPIGYNTLTVKYSINDPQAIIDKLEAKWNELFPEKAFEFNFLDEQLNSQYASFRNFGQIIQSFTGIAILISCLGVYGLVLFVVQRKVKEIGVRKVLGASEVSILRLIYQDFAVLILIAFVLGIPFSFYLISKWLENFTYHTAIDVLTYTLSLGIVLVVVGLTVGYQALRASLANPVTSLRTE